MANAFGVPIVQHPVYPYDESPPLDNIMSYITGSSIQWSSNPRITTTELTELHYLFFRIACHSLWPISHLHIIPLERYAFLYALVTDAPISFPHLFLRSLNEIYKSSSTSHALFFPIFIHWILLHLGLDDFLASEPVHIVTPIGATFLRQSAAQLRASSKHPRIESSSVAPPPPTSTGDTIAEASVDRLPLGGRRRGFSPNSLVSSSITHRRVILCLHSSSLLFYLSFYYCVIMFMG